MQSQRRTLKTAYRKYPIDNEESIRQMTDTAADIYVRADGDDIWGVYSKNIHERADLFASARIRNT